MTKVYRHKKTGKLYELVQERIIFKDITDEEYDTDAEGRPTCLLKREYEWRGRKKDNFEHLVLYKSLYNNEDGPYFVRHMEDFSKSFEQCRQNEWIDHIEKEQNNKD